MKNILHGNGSLGRKMQSLFLMTLFVLQSTLSLAQNRAVTGVVVDEKDEPIIGANVTVKGTSKGTITDLDGKFVISAPANAKLLEVSFIGYNTQTVTITGKTLQIKLTESAIALDEVVAIGYGSAKKGNVTGAIAKVNAEKLEDRATTNIASSLQGQLAGVEVRSTTGEPGSELQIRVRGAASINADATPLYVVDGIPVDDLGSLNPGDIQSIEVLKDASSSAIYGSRGANGVVLITTKQASADDKVKVQFQASFGIQSLERKVDVLSPEEWIEFRTAYNNNRYISQYGSKGATIEDDYATRLAMIGGKESYYFLNDPRWTEPGYGNLQLIDWQDEFFRLAPIQNYQLSLSSGRGNTKYRVSLGYTDQKGIAIESSYKRLNFRANVESKLFNRITVGVNLAPSANWSDGGRVDGKDRQATNVLTMVPVAEPEDGIYTGSGSKGYYRWTSSSKVSPIAYMEEVTNHGESVRFNSAAYVKADIWDGLKAEVTGSYNFSSTQSRSFIPSSVTKYRTDSEGYKTTASRSEARSNKFLLQTILHYNKTFGRHTVGAMAGYSMESSGGSSSKLSATQFPDNSLEVFDMADVVLTAAAASLSTPSRLMSYFGRVQYEYDDRYLLTASIRRDGSSRFGKENRWGVFPAVSAAYRISNEKFWPKDFFMNSLKIRGSWGANGNNSIPTNTALAKLSSANYSSGNIINGFAPTSLANPDLGWEKTESWNIAFDMGMFNNRIFLSADYYVKTTKDDIVQVTTSGASGFESAIQNVGEIRNNGVEVMVNAVPVHTKDFNWNSTFNIAYNSSDVKYLGIDGTGEKIKRLTLDGANSRVGSVSVQNILGHPYGELVGYEYKRTSDGQVIFENGLPVHSDEVQVLGNGVYKVTGGWRNEFTYKNITLSFLIDFKAGAKMFSGTNLSLYSNGLHKNTLQGRGADGKGTMVGNGVMSDGKGGYVKNTVAVSAQDYWQAITSQNIAEEFVYNASFIKLRELSVGYTLPQAWLNKQTLIKGVTLSLVGRNLWTILKHTDNIDPESAYNNGNAQGLELNGYPATRNVGFNVNVKF